MWVNIWVDKNPLWSTKDKILCFAVNIFHHMIDSDHWIAKVNPSWGFLLYRGTELPSCSLSLVLWEKEIARAIWDGEALLWWALESHEVIAASDASAVD